VSETGRWVAVALEQQRRMEIDNAGFTELVRLYQDMAYGYALSIVQDPYAAQDVAQEGFLRAWLKLSQLEDPEAFPGWLRGIVRRTALDELRRTRPAPLSEEQSERFAAPSASPEEEAQRRESIQEIREAIEGLPGSLRECVILHYLDGCPLAVVAEFLGIEPQAARKRLQRGRERMRKNLEHLIREKVRELRPSRDGRLVESVNLYANFSVAAQLGQIGLLEAMLVDGVDVNEPDVMGRTLLHWAVENGHPDAVELLMRNGADPDLRDREGRSPRSIAEAAEAGREMLRLMDERR
jgi:RNA polymerase sigma factor (sigma-70 family)